jgi:hypothetical protein
LLNAASSPNHTSTPSATTFVVLPSATSWTGALTTFVSDSRASAGTALGSGAATAAALAPGGALEACAAAVEEVTERADERPAPSLAPLAGPHAAASESKTDSERARQGIASEVACARWRRPC